MKRTVADTANILPDEEYEKHIDELQREWKSTSRTEQHVSTLLRETSANRRVWMSTLPSGKIYPVIEKFPCLEDGYHVSRPIVRFIMFHKITLNIFKT